MKQLLQKLNGVPNDLLRTGTALWKECYGDNTHNDRAAQVAVTARCAAMPGHLMQQVSVTKHDKWGATPDFLEMDHSVVDYMRFAAKWVDGGCRSITADSKYFAAMAQTKAEHARDELHIPWSAFVVHLPSGLIVDEQGNEYSLATFAQYGLTKATTPDLDRTYMASTSAAYSLIADDNVTIHSYWPDATLADLLCGPDPSNSTRYTESGVSLLEETASDARIRELVKRATVGLLYTIQYTNHWRFGGRFDRAGGGTKLRAGPPPHRTIFVGRPINIDVREAVRTDAMAGSRAAPSVQTLVRGHLKRQVIGVGKAGRKVIWVEPYWRGPEEAPILARPIKVGSTSRNVRPAALQGRP